MAAAVKNNDRLFKRRHVHHTCQIKSSCTNANAAQLELPRFFNAFR